MIPGMTAPAEKRQGHISWDDERLSGGRRLDMLEHVQAATRNPFVTVYRVQVQ